MADEKEVKKEVKKVKKPWAPKSHKDLVEWFVGQIRNGGATKREFLIHAEKLLAPKQAVKKK